MVETKSRYLNQQNETIMKTKANIKVFKSALSEEIIRRFSSIEDLLEWNKQHNVYADQIAINDMQLLGWDELYDFV